MPHYVVERYETYVQKYVVEAEDEALAIKAVWDCEAEEYGEPTFLETNTDLGMPAEEDPELVERLEELDEDVNPDVIESIRRVHEMDEKEVAAWKQVQKAAW